MIYLLALLLAFLSLSWYLGSRKAKAENNMQEHRILLSAEDFRTLVSGGIVEQRSLHGALVKVALSDIGFREMLGAIESAKANH